MKWIAFLLLIPTVVCFSVIVAENNASILWYLGNGAFAGGFLSAFGKLR